MTTDTGRTTETTGTTQGIPRPLVATGGAASPLLAVAPRTHDRRRRARRLGTGFVGVLAVLAVWQVLALALDDEVVLPTVQETARQFWQYMSDRYPGNGNTLWQDALISTARILAGFAVGSLVGIAVGAVMSSNRVVRDLVDPLIELTRPLPPLAFIPLFIVWFGIGERSKFALILVGVVPTVIIATVSALDAVPRELEMASRALGASHAHTLVFVRMRAALPGILTGMRLAMGGAWTSIVAVEMIAATSGVGFLIVQAGNYLQTPILLSGIVTISLLGIALDGVLRLLGRFTDPSSR
ncbi:NitT/TauT family transport system permease protein/taurine transport system permease protein [Motilibacter peucedani]|uniref:NitT/TauT family transport system permease protein/taurine transport system permease protein n=1 Tax=Motilibacter peucedani TaxID=598650 RepID=A0A420XPV4_9ACTN|nr:ABC transporter permease [Motilibacter peucedani]RKS75303.1 NitT/TauT family transport system permease protein/taurine transport system permease protein [Motilibacter peucedani]